ncbi:signal recognition particle-docking protein FtsY [Morganella morganii]|uniref:signal recognition particle-docking protein FtsY n=2 Tax=Morganella morganii TaxID=582 RepID=UPI000DE5C9F8|nr:signal recognition particle-docking protein FtsY [Morganella morganii]MBT0431393.1 signal recognition particle-docking protein FtsY [Morganella morganii subsp. morganii]SSN06629.1 signal recognition particle-docking protein FtsY [Klebsiella pneumoniae]EJD6110230.1 signal recognition particle-docking protein FtsY [Morganella morganii]EJG2206755.1 signal recognition particle-docking protein FtsY [Morganella morganii]EKU4015603.1 signal recognition particle-docking protein FtsY [Morganella mor
MAKEKKKGFFSWLGFGRKEDEQAQQEQAAQEEQARLAEEQTRRDAEAAEEARLAEEQARRDEEAAEQARLAEEQARRDTEAAEQARLAEEQARRDAEAAEQARLAEEQARRDAEAAEQARQAEEQARRDAEAAKQQRLAEERRQAEAQAAEQQRVEEEQRRLKEQALRDAEAAKQQRIAEEKRLAEEQATEQQRAEEEQRRLKEQALRDAEAAKQQRIAEEKRLAEEQAAAQRRAEEEQRRAEEQALRDAEIAKQQRIAEEKRLAEEQAAEQQRAEEEAAEQQRLAQEQKQRDAEAAEQARLAEEQRLAQEEEARRLAEVEAEAQDAALVENESPAPADTQERPAKEGFFARLKRSLVRTRENIGSGFFGIFRGKKIDDDLFEELEEQLLVADVGVETTRKIITSLTQHASRRDLKDAEALFVKLREEMGEILATVDKPLEIEDKKPYVILMVGVNGVGKTTTIGKMARQYQAQGKSVMLAAGDTFRAAAVEQLQVWGERNNIPVVAQHTGADPASVIFDAIQSAKAKGVDVLIADTAGRLQNKAHLMEELRKIVRVMKKLDEDAPHEIMLTLDASTGQNAVSQARLFNEAVGLTGLTLTKLDGTAKGGVIFAIADQFGIPIRYIGVGEGIEDLRPFKAGDFIEALFARED